MIFYFTCIRFYGDGKWKYGLFWVHIHIYTLFGDFLHYTDKIIATFEVITEHLTQT